jgi:hypothetical protein
VSATRPCKDCVSERAAGGVAETRPWRPAPYPGPRCTTHHRAQRRAARSGRRAAHVTRTYGITPEQTQAVLEAQGGRCAGCRRARGVTKALAVDHDHTCRQGHEPEIGCPACVRGLLCSTCNRTLGHFRDDPVALIRMALYLIHPPAREVLVGVDAVHWST